MSAGGEALGIAEFVTDIGQTSYPYDGEGRICAVQGTPIPGITTLTGYLYNAEGVRVAKGPITTMSCDPTVSGLLPSTETDYVLGLNDEQVSEIGPNGNGSLTWAHTNAWAGGKLIATYDKDGVHFYAYDWLGTRRVQTDYAGVVERNCFSLPFGDGETCLPTPTEHLFTGKERDMESGNDYLGARYYASSMGRFMSPDPLNLGANIASPQSWNMYSYSLSNPLVFVDPSGTDPFDPYDLGSYDASMPHGDSIFNWHPPAAAEDSYQTYLNTVGGISDQDMKSASIVVWCQGNWWCRVTSGQEWVQNPDHHYFWGDDDAYRLLIAQSISGQAGWAGTWRLPVYFYGGSLTGVLGGVAGDIGEVEAGELFGTRFNGNYPLLNSGDNLRVGWSYASNYGKYVFRIGGAWVSKEINDGHINLWPPSWRGGPPTQ